MVGASSDVSGRMAWLENFCRAHPLDMFVAGLLHLRIDLVEQNK
jgi:hypothetical protein